MPGLAAVPDEGERHLRVGESFEGPVVYISGDIVLVEIDGKRQGAIDATELLNAEGQMTVEVGSRIRAQVVAIDRDGNVNWHADTAISTNGSVRI